MKSIGLGLIVLIAIGCTSNNSEDSVDSPGYIDEIEKIKSDIIGLSTQVNQNPTDTAHFYANDAIFREIGDMNTHLMEVVGEAYGQVPTDSLLKAFDGFVPKEIYEKMSAEELSTEYGQKLVRSRQNFERLSADYQALVGLNICDPTSESASWVCNQLGRSNLVFFSSSWCGPCLQLEPRLEKYLEQNPEHKFFEIDIQDHPTGHFVHNDISQTSWERIFDPSPYWMRFGIPGVPFLMNVDQNGNIVGVLNPEQLEELVKDL